MPHQNLLLNRLLPETLAQMAPYFTTVELAQGLVLAETYEQIEKVYFPHSGIISCVVELAGGDAIQTAMIGRDGVFGASEASDDKLSLNHVALQVAGEMSVTSSDRFRQLVDQLPTLKKLIVNYERFLSAQAQQTAACNAIHTVEARTCKWLLRMNDLIGPQLPITQEFLAEMMGVRRTSVTTVAVTLQEAGMISYRRGHIQLLNLERIREAACDCHEAIRSHYERLFGPDIERASTVPQPT
jgi:CRP-like cAMP-binding protein